MAKFQQTHVPALGVDVHARVWRYASPPEMLAPLVLVAGMGVSSRYWVPLARRLAGRFHVLAPDLPGFGSTPKPPDAPWPAGPDAREQADQLLAWMDAQGIERAVLCGHSNGCQTVVDLAARFPDRVEQVILASPTYALGHRTLRSQVPRLILAGLFERPSLHLVLAVEYGSAGPVRAAQQGIRMLNDPIEKKLPYIQAPTLVLRGEFDPIVPQRWAETVASILPQGTFVVIERVGHAVQYSAAGVTAEVISEFLQGKLDVPQGAATGSVVAGKDDPRHDPFGPPQPIAPGLHGALDYLASSLALTLPQAMAWGPRTRRVLTAAAVGSTVNNLVSDHTMSLVRRLPMVTHATLDIASGLQLLIAAMTYLRREPRGARLTTAALGLYQILSAALTVKPTGPARCTRGRSS